MNCWESFYIKIFQQQNILIEEQKVKDLNLLYSLANVKRRRHGVRHPPQFSTYHPSTLAATTRGKSIMHCISTSVFIFYPRINLYIILNVILFIAEYSDVYTGT